MVPVVKRTIYLMLQNNEIDPGMREQFDETNGILNIEILTGLQSLSRESDLTKLLQMGEMVRNLPPDAASSFKWESYARALITSLGFDPSNWVKSEEDIRKEEMEAADRQQQMEMQKMYAQSALNTVSGAAQQDMLQNGGKNIPPQFGEQALKILGPSLGV
jgi:hypothetical protein